MKRHSLKFIFFTLITCNIGFTGISTLCAQAKQPGGEIIKLMHQRYFNGPCKAYTFSQRNSHYRNDSVVRHSEWHEALEFPDKFRINFGDKADGNFVVFKNDSAYNYKKGRLLMSRRDSNMILLLIGGMYYRTLADVLARIKHAKYDLSTVSSQKWKNEDVYVIGAKENNLAVNQLWVEKKTLRIVRIIENLNADNRMDMSFETHQPWCKGFIETKVAFRRNGKLEQLEEYYDIKESAGFQK